MIVETVIKNGASLVDVREEIELLADGEVPGAVNIPIGELEDRKDEILEMQKPIVFFCRSGGRAQQAVDLLKDNGCQEVYNGGGYGDVNQILSNS